MHVDVDRLVGRGGQKAVDLEDADRVLFLGNKKALLLGVVGQALEAFVIIIRRAE